MGARFAPGDRVRLSPLARRKSVYVARYHDRLGTVGTTDGMIVFVLWDGRRTATSLHRDFLQKASPPEPGA